MRDLILGIETSCDDTCAAVVDSGGHVLSSVIGSQTDLHARYGGVVPEVASRAHSRNIVPAVRAALEEAAVDLGDMALVAVTRGPGLVGSLLVGLMAAKGISWGVGIPLVGVNHLTAHMWAAALDSGGDLPVPSVCLVVSGGHTELILIEGLHEGEGRLLGQTRDDAAGEAFDKVARILGLGYPGGPVIDGVARGFTGEELTFPRPMKDDDSCDFSFSGLKTAVALHVEERRSGLGLADTGALPEDEVARTAASFQRAVVDVLVAKTERAVRLAGVDTLIAAGGVAANSELRLRLSEVAEHLSVKLVIPPPRYCTDNAAMVAAAGYHKFATRGADGLDLDVDPSLTVPVGAGGEPG